MNKARLERVLREFTDESTQQLTDTVKRLRNELDFSRKGYITIRLSSDEKHSFDKHLWLLKELGVIRSSELQQDNNEYKIRLRERDTVQLYDYLTQVPPPDENHLTDSVSGKTDGTAKLSLNSATKTVRLTFMGKTVTIKQFTSKKNDNFIMFRNLYLNPNQALTRTKMGVSKGGSVVKDIPKTMGFTSELKNIFFTTDKEEQTLTLHPEKILTPEEAEIITSFVNSQNHKK